MRLRELHKDVVTATWVLPVDRLHKVPLGWQVQAGGERQPVPFDAVVLALPPAQSAAMPQRGAGARQACTAPAALEAAHQTAQRLFA